jgi:hypothetical protein
MKKNSFVNKNQKFKNDSKYFSVTNAAFRVSESQNPDTDPRLLKLLGLDPYRISGIIIRNAVPLDWI